MKCEICSNIKDYKECRRGRPLSDIFYDKESGKYILVLEQFSYEYAEMYINYCPKCGKELNKGEI